MARWLHARLPEILLEISMCIVDVQAKEVYLYGGLGSVLVDMACCWHNSLLSRLVSSAHLNEIPVIERSRDNPVDLPSLLHSHKKTSQGRPPIGWHESRQSQAAEYLLFAWVRVLV